MLTFTKLPSAIGPATPGSTVLAFFLSIAFFPTISAAQSAEVRINTQSGCSIYTDAMLPEMVVTWSGECIEGLAHGLGVLLAHNPTGAVKFSFKETFKADRGKKYGFVKYESVTEMPFPEKPPCSASVNMDRLLGIRCVDTPPDPPLVSKIAGWRLVWQGRSIGFNGLGLTGHERLLDHEVSAMPLRSHELKPQAFISVGNDKLELREASCMIEPTRFKNCGAGPNQEQFNVYYLQPAGGPRRFCPAPYVASCAGVAAEMIAPYVEGAESFIRVTMPHVHEVELVMRRAQVAAVRQRELAAISKVEAVAESARREEAAKGSFDMRLDTASVGELFAMADEFRTVDTARARTALRKLIVRFPDHKLAALAASMLIEMQDKRP